MKKASDGSSEEAVAGRRRGGEALCLETFTRLACLLAAAEDFAEAREPGDDKQGEALLCRRREKRATREGWRDRDGQSRSSMHAPHDQFSTTHSCGHSDEPNCAARPLPLLGASFHASAHVRRLAVLLLLATGGRRITVVQDPCLGVRGAFCNKQAKRHSWYTWHTLHVKLCPHHYPRNAFRT